MERLSYTLGGYEVSDLPGPAPIEPDDAVVPDNAPAAVAHLIDVQIPRLGA